jgi:adenosyl cobinamide kinase/adenosyl cobinamide phosphate guanylyltransferase
MSKCKRSPQLNRDIIANANDRLHQWLQDTIMRCKAAELRPHECHAIMVACLTAYVANLTKTTNKKQNTVVLKWMRKALKAAR